MALSSQVKNNFNLSRGFISDASAVNFPEDGTLDELNFSIEKDGSRKKRSAIDITYTGVPSQTAVSSVANLTGLVTSSYVWNNPGNLDKTYLCHQINSWLYVYDITNSPEDYTSELIFTTDLLLRIETYSAGNQWSIGNYARLQYTSGSGFLFITAPGLKPSVIRWDADNQVLSASYVDKKIRDFEGLPATSATDSAHMSREDYYNFRNAGWPETVVSTWDYTMDPVLYYKWASGESADLQKPWYFGRLVHTEIAADVGRWYFGAFDESEFGTSEPIRGSKIISVTGVDRAIGPRDDSIIYATVDQGSIDAYNYNHLSTEEIAYLLTIPPYDDILEGDSFVQYRKQLQDFVGGSFNSGRFWVASGDTVYFSQIIKDYTDAGKFYQANDPTNELINELLESDGGVIKIPNTGKIVSLREFGPGVLVFATNGIWMISGGDTGFTAKAFKVDKISSTPCRSHYNVLDIENIMVMYNEYGIYTMKASDTGGVAVEDITEGTISEFYANIGLTAIESSKALYDPVVRELYIFYSDLNASDTDQRYNKILGAKLPAFSFFKYEIPAEDAPRDAFVYDAYISPITFSVEDDYQVITSISDTVIDVALDNIVIPGSVQSPTFAKLTMLSMVGNATTPTAYYSKATIFDNTLFADYYSVNSAGVPYEGYLHTGYMTEEDVMRFKQAPYIQCVFNRTETRFVDNGSGGLEFDRPSSCLLQSHWDWTDHANSGKIDNSQEVYRFVRNYIPSGIGDTFDSGYPVVTTKNKLRGRGRSLHLKFTSPAGYDCHMLGWGINIQGLTKV